MRTRKLILLIAIFALGMTAIAEAGISRVARRYNFVQFYGSYSQPVGEHDQLFITNFIDFSGRSVDIDADQLYDPSYQIGFSYGQLRNDHIAFSLGFTYTDIEMVDSIAADNEIFVPGADPSLNQYDLDFDLNYLFSNPAQSKIAPFVGLGFHGGITSLTAKGFESENEVTLALGVNLGADFVIWEASDNRSFVTLSTVNEFQVLASDARPRYLNLGIGLKYYFRP